MPDQSVREPPDRLGHKAPVRERLLEAARQLFAAEGYEGASTASITRRAGTSESQLVKHFGSKEELLEAVFDEGWHRLDGQIRRVLAGVSSPVDKLTALGGGLIAALGKDRQLRTLLLLEGRRVRKRGAQVVLSAGFRQFVNALDGVLQEMKAARQLRAGVDLQAARSALIGAVEGLLRDQLLSELMDYPARYGKKELLSTFTLVVGSFLEPSAARARLDVKTDP